MAQRHAFLLLLLALYLVVSVSAAADSVVDASVSAAADSVVDAAVGSPSCNGLVGDCINKDTEIDMESKTNRRALWRHVRYISYGALYRDNVPCSRRGTSYYNCTKFKKVNPYRRGCSHITGCARDLY